MAEDCQKLWSSLFVFRKLQRHLFNCVPVLQRMGAIIIFYKRQLRPSRVNHFIACSQALEGERKAGFAKASAELEGRGGAGGGVPDFLYSPSPSSACHAG